MSDSYILTGNERACLLRALRTRLSQLEQDLAHLSALPRNVQNDMKDHLILEIGCIKRGIAWLWQQPFS